MTDSKDFIEGYLKGYVDALMADVQGDLQELRNAHNDLLGMIRTLEKQVKELQGVREG